MRTYRIRLWDIDNYAVSSPIEIEAENDYQARELIHKKHSTKYYQIYSIEEV